MDGIFSGSRAGGEIVLWPDEIAYPRDGDHVRPAAPPPFTLGPAWSAWLSPEGQAYDDL